MNHREKRQALAGTLALAALVGVALCPFFANKRLDDCHKNLLSYTGVEYTLCLHNLTAQPVVDLFSEAMFTKQRNDAIMERLVYGLVSSAKGKKALIEDNQAILGKPFVYIVLEGPLRCCTPAHSHSSHAFSSSPPLLFV